MKLTGINQTRGGRGRKQWGQRMRGKSKEHPEIRACAKTRNNRAQHQWGVVDMAGA